MTLGTRWIDEPEYVAKFSSHIVDGDPPKPLGKSMTGVEELDVLVWVELEEPVEELPDELLPEPELELEPEPLVDGGV
jgi:hypothetical protein